MNSVTRFLAAVWETTKWDLLSLVCRSTVKFTVGRISYKTQSGAGRLLSVRLLARRSPDGAILDGPSCLANAKYSLRKGLPSAGQRRLAVENDPHSVDGFDGKITAGYGKGEKRLVASGSAIVKIADQRFVSRYNYHEHQAERAGLHYDFVVEGVKPGTSKWEVHIPSGLIKGRYAFVTSDRGVLVVPMKDQGLVIAKPAYRLKTKDFLSELGPEWIVEQKFDGAMSNILIDKNRAIFRSHRETGETYYDRIPHLEDLSNRSRLFSCRLLFPGPDLSGTVLRGELVHPDGAARMGGILNANPEKAQQIQKLRGKAEFYIWDIVRYKGRDVSTRSYRDRREILEVVAANVRRFNPWWHIVPAARSEQNAQDFYKKAIGQGLPYGEGVVVKSSDPGVRVWYKVKATDTVDLPVVAFLEGSGKYKGTLGRILVENPANGARGEIGSFAISDSERDWIWQNRGLLEGQTAEIRAQELTSRGVLRAGVFVRWHPSKSETGLLMYAEGLDLAKGRVENT